MANLVSSLLSVVWRCAQECAHCWLSLLPGVPDGSASLAGRILFFHSVNVCGQLGGGVHEVLVAGYVISVKNRSSFVARNPHGDGFGHPGAHQVANSCPAEIVEDSCRLALSVHQASRLARSGPSPAEVPDAFTRRVPEEYPWASWVLFVADSLLCGQ